MNIINALKKWNERKENSDLKRVKVTSSGTFYMKSKDLFDNKKETLDLLNKLNKSIENRSLIEENKREFSE